jgi:hypothetical protein
VGLLAALLAFGILVDAFEPAPSGPPSSSYATTPRGVAAWAELLQRSGHPVLQLREPISQAPIRPGMTLVVLGVQSLTRPAERRIDAFVQAGGRLVIDASDPDRVLGPLIGGAPAWTASSPRFVHPLARVPETAGVTSVRTAGDGAWIGGAGQPVLGDSKGGALLVIRRRGRGQVDLLAAPSPVQNRLLATADNAQFAINLAGAPGRPVVFAEALHGFGAATGIAALPGTFWVVFSGMCLAGAMWALDRGRRLGPPEPPVAIGPPPRSAYVDAMAGALKRADDTASMAALARGRIEEELMRRRARRAGRVEGARLESLIAIGLSEREAQLVLAPPSSGDGDAELLVLGRVLARLRSRR